MLGLDNPIHIAFVLVLLLLVFGAKRLPELGKSLGEGLRGFKDSIGAETPAADLTQTFSPAAVDETPVVQVIHTDAEPSTETTPMRPAA